MSAPAEAVRIGGRSREALWNLPNAITLGRIGAVPLLLAILWLDGPAWSALLGVLFLAISLTDLADGYVARRFGSVTRIGKLLDPLADKLLVMTALVVLCADGRLPAWAVPLVIAILAREISVTTLRAMASAEGVVIPAAPLGKWKTGLQSAAITGLIIHHPWFGVSTHALGLLLLVAATGLTLWSGYVYLGSYLAGRLSAR